MSSPAIDDNHIRLRRRTQIVPGGTHLLLRLGERRTKMPRNHDTERLLHRLAQWGPKARLDDGDLEEFVEHLDATGFLERPADRSGIEPDDVDRFDRLLNYLSEFESAEATRFDSLRRLRNATVTVVGTGGAGSWLLYGLLGFGVGSLRLIDGDVVEASNLNRSIIFSEASVGSPKVHAAADTMRRFASRTQVEGIPAYVESARHLAELAAGSDLIICCADKPMWRIRRWTAEAGHLLGVPNINCSGMQVGPLHVPGEHTSCTNCLWLHQCDEVPGFATLVRRMEALPAGDSGALCSIGAMAASVASSEAFALLSGAGRPATVNGIWESLGPNGTRVRALPRHDRCPY